MEREQEIEILERLCGWRWMKRTAAPLLYPPHLLERIAEEGWSACDRPVSFMEEYVIGAMPPISTDETAAFKWVVPAMKVRHSKFSLQDQYDAGPLTGYKYRAIFRTKHIMIDSWTGIADSAAEAICLAALAWIDAQPKGE